MAEPCDAGAVYLSANDLLDFPGILRDASQDLARNELRLYPEPV